MPDRYQLGPIGGQIAHQDITLAVAVGVRTFKGYAATVGAEGGDRHPIGADNDSI